jgi:two-component sensor histidine kinase
VSAEQEAQRELIESEERLHLAMEAGRLAVYEIELTSGRLSGSTELNLLYGLPFDARPTLADLRAHYAPGELERLEKEGVTYERVRDVLRVGAADGDQANRTKVEAELTIITPAGITKHLDYRAQYVRGSSDDGSRLIGVLVDVSDRKRAEDRLTVIADELHHRMKNTLAVVHAIASQTFRSGETTEASLQAFLARLQALAAATAALLRENGAEISVREIVQLITEPYRSPESDPFSFSGDEVRTAGKLVTSLAMALHELSTNAIKHGALSRPEGRVYVAWRASEDGILELRWQETGGPAVTPPSRRGFGSRLLSTLIPHGSIAQDFAPDGLVCVIRCKLDSSS